MTHALHVWAEETRIATIEHEGRDDRWNLSYAEPWVAEEQSYPLSPALPLTRPPNDYPSASIKRFIEHLLPEGRALDVAVAYNGLTKTNIFGLIWALGAETAGALRFTGDAAAAQAAGEPVLREVSRQELDQRIAEREHVPLTVWDGKVRMSVAGLQDKLLVYLDRPLNDGGRLFLVDGQRLASTHILKPDTANPKTPHLAVNEHFCMSLARRMGLPAAEVGLLRTPRPVLVVRRFDRAVEDDVGQPRVHRLHIIDACQACDLPVAYKYERNLGNAPAVQNIRDGVSFERLFGCAELTANTAAARLAMLRWALFQFLIGNSDAHGKNFSFFVRPGGLLEPTPWYDLVSVLQYDGFDTELAMAYGDVFSHAEVSPFAFADFAARCGIDRKLMRREGQRLAKLAATEAAAQAKAIDYEGEVERAFVQGIAGFVAEQAQRLTHLVAEAARLKDEYL
ncbi:phosphatidylinositol kinase [Rubrivivax gelatinosus]|uniref:HipA domain-containing protein n=1 Tax=Rubrivivax gelatinosus TaxID=28068 RepID=UPI001906F061|nr:HipA domain-containing protein [Rubrivivax gelatinosus]MBK1613105.1 phosphatidylinositol kinase [Rubrivivax gelatinosus]MBZ8142887.1 phosphatidylinositol kinase [Rubrivivax gelatinosus]